MEKDEMDIENPSYTLKGSSETLLPIQLFEFKAHLLEAVEELRMGRLAKIQYEEQINKILVEKQELTWQCESLSKQEEIVEKKHNDSLTVLKKQLQVKLCLIEEDKGRFQMAAETKERENFSLREDIKALQIAKYSFQKKIHEMNVNENWLTEHSVQESEEQKVQLHILAKEDHIKQLGECKKCIGNVTQQFGMIKEVHEKLEQTVQTAIQNNKKLKIEINQKNNKIEELKEELKKLSSNFRNYKVTFQQRTDEEDRSLSEKEQHVKELKERLQTEREINKKLMEENISMKEGKQEDIKALSNMRTLVQRHTQIILSLEKQLSALKEDYKTLERDNELQRAKATENEEKFLALQSEQEGKAQASEHQSSMDIAVCNIESITSESRTQNDSAAFTATSYVGSSNNVSLSVTSNEVQKMDGSKVEIVLKDANSLQNVYNIIDKGHLGEKQKDESSLAENKVSFSDVQQNIHESCHGKWTGAILVHKAHFNVVEEYENRAVKGITTIQAQTTPESIKMCPDNNKPPTVCREDARQPTDSSHRKSGDGTSEEVYIVIDKPDRTDEDRGDLINETCQKESQILNQTIERLINEQDTSRDNTPTGNSPACALRDGSNYHLPVLNKDASEISRKSYSEDQMQQSKVAATQPTNKNPQALGVDSQFPEEARKTDTKSVQSRDIVKHRRVMGTTSHTSINVIERAEMKSNKCLGQESNLTVSYSSQGSVENTSLQSALDLKREECNVQLLQSTENANLLEDKTFYIDIKEKCPPDTDANTEETIECDVNMKSNLHSDHGCQQTDQTSDPVNEDDGKVCIKENDNAAAGSMSQVVSSSLCHDGKSREKLAPLQEEKFTPNGKSPTHLSNLKKVYLPGSNLQDSLNSPLSSQTNCILSNLSSQDIYPRTKQVPRNDHSAEWNSEQAFHNSSILATSSENSGVDGKPNLCPSITESTRPYLINLPSSAQTVITGSNKDISSIQRQISAIERFLFNNKLNGARKRKLEDTESAEE